jgi:uncharacterized protein with ParB-like and HNH nuclease domain
MSKMTIRGSEYPIKKIFSDDFVFTIPLYQRAYAWTTEEAEDLLQDLLGAMEGYSGGNPIDELPPYFLGSIVLMMKSDGPDAEIIDGQQRITTLTMLLATLRSLVQTEYVESLTAFLCEKGNVVTGTPTRYRLRLRERDAEFFKQHIQHEDGIAALMKLQDMPLPESQRNIRDNTLAFLRELQKLSPEQLMALTQFIVNRCFLIVVCVDTPDIDSAYRIFSVLNNRGRNLSYSDIIKAEVISAIPIDEREGYTAKWEELEEMLGSETFETLFSDLRTIFSRQRLHKGMIEEFHAHVYPRSPQTSTPQEFIDNVLKRYAQALNLIVRANYERPTATKEIKEINSMFKWLKQLDYSRWIPPTLYYFYLNWDKYALLLRFLNDLERLVVFFSLCHISPYKRIERYCYILDAIYHEQDLYAVDSPLQLTGAESREFVQILDGNLYQSRYICKYILLRLDERLSERVASYDYQAASVEHVLPQRPAYNSEWVRHFPSRDVRDKYVHRLGNLALLSRGRNMDAENFEFERKKRVYFSTDGGISPFVITTQVLSYQEWTPAVIELRQTQLLGQLKKLWRL